MIAGGNHTELHGLDGPAAEGGTSFSRGKRSAVGGSEWQPGGLSEPPTGRSEERKLAFAKNEQMTDVECG